MLIDAYERHPFGFGMIGVGSGLSASAISLLQQLDLVIRVAGGFVALLVGIIVLILQGHKLFCCVRKWAGYSTLILLACAMTACTAVPVRVPLVSTAAVSTMTAVTANAKTIRSNAAAQATLSTARAKAAQLAVLATPEQQPIIEQLTTALDAANTELAGSRSSAQATADALDESAQGIEHLQTSLSEAATALDSEQTAHKSTTASRDFWRSATWKLSLLALALGLWTFRKPLLALTGVPTWLPV